MLEIQALSYDFLSFRLSGVQAFDRYKQKLNGQPVSPFVSNAFGIESKFENYLKSLHILQQSGLHYHWLLMLI